MPHNLSHPTRPHRARRGMVLVVVLVVVALLALSAYTFAALMATHLGAAKLAGRQLQCRELVASGVEAVRLHLMRDEAARSDAGGEFDNPAHFQAVPVLAHEDAAQRANFTVLAPNVDDQGRLAGVRHGLDDESARLHLNALLTLDRLRAGTGRDLLMGLPGMTVDVADAILDWMDDDDEPREYGAESSYYQGCRPAYAAKNGPLDTVEELLLIRGVTPQLLFGTDTNRNGMVDPHESSLAYAADAARPTLSPTDATAAAGSMDRGWSGYLTIYSAEKNVSSAGTPRIDLNQDDLATLYHNLAAELNEDWAKFIVLYRQYGAYDGEDAGEDVATITDIDLTQPGGTKLTQVLDLIGAKVQRHGGSGEGGEGEGEGEGEGKGKGKGRVVAAVFPETPEEMMVYLPILMDHVTVTAQPVIPGRININRAPRAILQAIPGLDPTLVDEILRQRVYDAKSDADALARRHETWLLTSGIVTLDEMKQLMPFVCARGDVYRAQVVGYYEDGGAAARAEVIFDATGAVPRIVSWREISHLGRGYPLDVLGVRFPGGY